tara:strand:+ start:792 stop:974 length:183 start_codon:yes stop_codon:yes gene_type:complete
MKFKPYDKVEVNGNSQARIINYIGENMYDVRLWSNSRHVGDITVNENEIKLIKESEDHND